MYLFSPEHPHQALAERAQRRVGPLVGAPPEVHGHVDSATVELPLVKEAEAGREERDGGRGPVLLRRKLRRGARLVVVLQEPRRVLLEIGSGPQVLAHGTRVPGAQRRTLLLQGPLEVPVHLRHEEEAGVPGARVQLDGSRARSASVPSMKYSGWAFTQGWSGLT